MRAALPAVDAAVVVCEADEKKVPQLQLILRELEDLKIPRFLFLNKIDKADKRVRETLKLLQPASRVPLVLRQIPIWTDDIVIGFVDLALERAYVYKEHAPSEVVPLEGENADREKEARFSMLETLADHDDELMEQLLDDIQPPRDKVFDDLAKELRDGLICPVLIGSATRTNGVLRLLKALRHEAPGVADTVQAPRRQAGRRRGRLRAQDAAHRARRQDVDRARARRPGRRRHDLHHAGRPRPGACRRRVQADRPEHREARRRRRPAKPSRSASSTTPRPATRSPPASRRIPPVAQVDALSAGAGDRDRRQGAQGRRQARPGAQQADRGGSLADRRAQSRDPRDRGVGAGRDAPARRDRAARRPLRRRRSTRHKPSVGYRETISKPVLSMRGRHKKQSGGHGQFGDVVLDIKPLPRGAGFKFDEKITGGVVPRNYIPSVEEGVIDALKHGPLGFPVVDVAVTLTDGSYHAVDSSDMAFRQAGRIGMHEALPQCQPVLLEPIHLVEIVCPTEATAKINAHPVGAARPDPRLRHARRLGRLGLGAGADAGSRDRRPDHRGALGDRRRRHLHRQVRPHGRTDRPHRRPDRRGEEGRAGGGVSHGNLAQA